jgi:DNA-binding transcriptional regulator YiaG
VKVSYSLTKTTMMVRFTFSAKTVGVSSLSIGLLSSVLNTYMTQTTMTDWTPDTIKALRTARRQSQSEFGQEIYRTTPGAAQRRVSDLERGVREPRTAEKRTLDRMEAGEI